MASASPSHTQDQEPPVIVDLVQEGADADHTSPTWALAEPLLFNKVQLGWITRVTLGERGSDAWFRRHAAARDSSTSIKLVVRGNRDKKIRITNIRTVKKCGRPLNGTLFYNPPGGASDELIRLYFDLDKSRPEAQMLKGFDPKGGYFSLRTVSLKRDEDMAFLIYASTLKHYCSFSLALDVLADGRQQTVTVTNHGQPFRITALYTKKGKGGDVDADVEKYKFLYVAGNGDFSGKHVDEWRRWDPREYVRAEVKWWQRD
ncbi:hypothetical protein [Microbispora sp. NPDC049125]|uniref:hypothetical protein n=1 Tax=Microbispora sp. NPDC049125 TaxID=3154929 RepID=UPI003467344A